MEKRVKNKFKKEDLYAFEKKCVDAIFISMQAWGQG